MLNERDQLQNPKLYVTATFLSRKNSKIQYLQDSTRFTFVTKKFIAAFKVPPSNKPTVETQITPPVIINSYPIMLETSSDIK